MPKNSFSVVIPAYNEAANLGRVLDALHACESANAIADIVVVDNLSTDDTMVVARTHGAQVIENQTGRRMTIARLRNIGACSTSAPILAFIDADVLVPVDWLAKATERFDAGLDGALGFVERIPADACWVGRVWGNRHDADQLDQLTDYLPGRNILVSRTAFNAIDGFDETLTTSEDKDFTLRLRRSHYPVWRSPATFVTHLGSERSLIEFIQKEFWRQSSTLAYAKKHHYTLRTLRNPLLSLWHLGCAILMIGAAISQSLALTLWTGPIWLAPAVILTLDQRRKFPDRRDDFLAILLTFLRWNISGAALVWQITDLLLLLNRSKKESR